MKRFLTILMALVLSATMVFGLVAYADEVETADETAEIAEETTEESLPELSEEDYNSIKETIVFDMTDPEAIEYKDYLVGTDAALDYYKNFYISYYGTISEDTEIDGVRTLILAEAQITKNDLISLGIGLIEKEGLFYDKTTYMAVDVAGSGNYKAGKLLRVLKFDFPFGIVSCTNVDKDKGGVVVKEIIAGENNNYMFSYVKINWINVLIALMILVVLVLLVLLIVFAIKKKKEKLQDEEFDKADALDEIKDNTEDVNQDAEMMVEEVAEEVKEEIVEENSEEDNSEK